MKSVDRLGAIADKIPSMQQSGVVSLLNMFAYRRYLVPTGRLSVSPGT